MTQADPGHVPVLLDEVLEHLVPQPGESMLDCTCGLGGHSVAMLATGATVTGVDRDIEARQRAASRLAEYGEAFQPYAGTFADAAEELAHDGQRFDGILADLGVSSLQLDDGDRFFDSLDS